MPNIAAATFGLNSRPAAIASFSVARRHAVDRRRGGELAGFDPDDLAVDRLRRDEVRFRLEHLRAAGGEPRFGLRHVGARHLADIEAVAGLAQLLLQHLDVAALEIEDRAIAQQVHVGGRGVEQDLLLGDRERRAAGRHLGLGLTRPVGGLEAVEQGLRDVEADGMRRKCRLGGAVDRSRPGGIRAGHRRPLAARKRLGQRLLVLAADIGGQRNARPVARQGLRHALVERTQRVARWALSVGLF